MTSTKQFPIRNLTKKLGRVVPMIFMLLVLSPVVVRGQKFKLKHMDIGLMNGQLISCQLIDILPDSIVILEHNKPVEGCTVYIRFKKDMGTMSGTLLAITESTMVLETPEAPGGQQIQRNQIQSLRVTAYPKSISKVTSQRSTYGYQQIEYVAIHKIGSGGVGAVLGCAAGIGIGWVLAYNTAPNKGFLSRDISGAGGAMLGGLLGIPIGAVFGSANRRRMIHGDKEKFDALMARLQSSIKKP